MVFRGSLEKRSMLSVLGPIAQGGIDHYGQDQVPDLPIPGSSSPACLPAGRDPRITGYPSPIRRACV